MVRRRLQLGLVSGVFLTSLWACQTYEFGFVPDQDRRGAHLRFTVEQPSKADILFVIDNSTSMSEEQEALRAAVERLLDELSGQDTSYRIGIVSTDAHGLREDCSGVLFDAVEGDSILAGHAGRGNCGRPEVVLNRPHDGARGRLIAAYDPAVFDVAHFPELSAQEQQAFAALMPKDATGARWVIDREQIRDEACGACGVTLCREGDPLFDDCARDVTRALVRAYFEANVNGLGLDGFGWEEGIKSGLLAVGIDPEQLDATVALNPGYDLTRAGRPNSYLRRNADGQAETVGWVRDDSLLAMMFVTDEDDCSAPKGLMDIKSNFEENSTPPLPAGSMCYQERARGGLLRTGDAQEGYMGSLLRLKRENVDARVAIGVIAGLVKQGEEDGLAGRVGEATACLSTAAPIPSTDCTCLQGAVILPSMEPDNRWCELLDDLAAPLSEDLRCDALPGARYVDFANVFSRHTFESICRADRDANDAFVAFGEALADFARIATLACFDLNEVAPVGGDPGNIQVLYAPKEAPDAPYTLPLQEDHNTLEEGWYYDAGSNTICLTGLDRTIDDVYDIFVLYQDAIQFVD